jgi:hypothetical protein
MVGGYARAQRRLSLHGYRPNTRLTRGATPADCHRLTAAAFRTRFVSSLKQTAKQNGAALAPQGESLGSPRRVFDDIRDACG